MAFVYIGIGSNVGDRKANIDRAVSLLKEEEEIDFLAISKIIETEPMGGPPQDLFLNGVIKIKTDLLPLDLLSKLKGIERRLGRVKTEEKNQPRSMDLDILFYDDVVIVDGKSLTIPHPRLQERSFVLEPLSELAPDFIHPRLGKSVAQLKEELGHENFTENRRFKA